MTSETTINWEKESEGRKRKCPPPRSPSLANKNEMVKNLRRILQRISKPHTIASTRGKGKMKYKTSETDAVSANKRAASGWGQRRRRRRRGRRRRREGWGRGGGGGGGRWWWTADCLFFFPPPSLPLRSFSLSSVLSFSPPFLFPFIFLLTSFIVVFIAFVLEDVLSVISMKSSYLYHIQLIVYLVAIRHSICVHSCHNTFSSFHYSFIFKASVANLRAIGINSNSC